MAERSTNGKGVAGNAPRTYIIGILLDTHFLLWVAVSPIRLPTAVQDIIRAPDNILCYSIVSIWEVAIKFSLRRSDFQVDPRILHIGLLENGYKELALTAEHAVRVSILPPIHRDPFDRMLIAQAVAEDIPY